MATAEQQITTTVPAIAPTVPVSTLDVQPEEKPVEYLVEMKEVDERGAAWRPYGSVTVPPRTQRRTVVKRAIAELSQLRDKAMEGEIQVRVIAVDDVYVQLVEYEVPPPVLKIGGEAVTT